MRHFERMLRTVLASALLLQSAACSSEEAILLVELRTDYAPVTEFDRVEVRVADRVVEHIAGAADYASGVRVAEIQGLPLGTTVIAVRLLYGGTTVRETVVTEDVTAGTAIVVEIFRCTGGSCPDGGGPGMDGGASDAGGMDAPLDAGSPDGSYDSGLIDDCTCRDPMAVCHREANECVRGACSSTVGCLMGYECASNVCRCLDPTLCGATCASDADCDGFVGRDCDMVRGVCRAGRTCVDDRDCPMAEICRTRGHCSAPTGAGLGEPCTAHVDCRSDACVDGECVISCTAGRDCPAAVGCEIVGSPNARTCVTSPGTTCAETEFAAGGACYTACRTNADCPGEACTVFPASDRSWLACGPSAGLACMNDEFEAQRVVAPNPCLTHTACWEDTDCPPSLICMHIGSHVFGFTRLFESSGLCGHF